MQESGSVGDSLGKLVKIGKSWQIVCCVEWKIKKMQFEYKSEWNYTCIN